MNLNYKYIPDIFSIVFKKIKVFLYFLYFIIVEMKYWQKDLEQRKKEFSKIKEKYPERVPIIIESKMILGKNKFLIEQDRSMSDLLYFVRRQIKLKPNESIFMFCNNELIPMNELLYTIYNRYYNKDDGFLYMTLQTENTFG